MILVDGHLWPVIVLGSVDDRSVVPCETVLISEQLLEMSDRLAVAIVVAGNGDAGVRSQHAALRWLEGHERLVRSHALRLAWVIEDDRIRVCTDAWLGCIGQTVFNVRTATFRSVQMALAWLLDTPWPAPACLDASRRGECT